LQKRELNKAAENETSNISPASITYLLPQVRLQNYFPAKANASTEKELENRCFTRPYG
jgi:hypothetical protein